MKHTPSNLPNEAILFWGLSLILFLLAFIPRWLWAMASHPPPFSDMEDYYLCAVNYLRGSYLAMSTERLAYRPPLYPLFLAGCMKWLPEYGLTGIRMVQAILGSLSVVLLFTIFLHSFKQMINQSRSIAFPYIFSFLGALSFAGMRNQVFFSAVLMTETLFIFGLLGWVWILIYSKNSGRLWGYGLFSLILGLLALIRPIALFFLPILIYTMIRLPFSGKRGISFWIPLFIWMLPILPWTIRNALVLGYFVPISTNAGINFYIGHNPTYEYYSTGNKEWMRREFERQFGVDEVLEDRHFFQLGMNYLAQHPLSLIPHSLKKLNYLYLDRRPPWPMDEYDRGTRLRFGEAVPWPLLNWNPCLLFFAILGVICAILRKLDHGVYLSIIGLYTMSCLLYFARTRFRLPIEPFLLMYIWIGVYFLLESGMWAFRKLFWRIANEPPPS
ncbi:MAG: hypothetical protein C4527_09300 [Candidatus Omnitrophota bacterium]|jgi:hypothetical protein|nr:MAG: hypothetical protein C4527_09300 [Candidatus Omnitrophota bacterium]